MVRVRFHLGAGENYGKWQIRHADGRVEYHSPDTTYLRMYGCRLRNRRGTAQAIHAGENKSPCAWVEAERVSVQTSDGSWPYGRSAVEVQYNPKVAPHWRDLHGRNIDGERFATILTSRRALLAWRQAVYGE